MTLSSDLAKKMTSWSMLLPLLVIITTTIMVVRVDDMRNKNTNLNRDHQKMKHQQNLKGASSFTSSSSSSSSSSSTSLLLSRSNGHTPIAGLFPLVQLSTNKDDGDFLHHLIINQSCSSCKKNIVSLERYVDLVGIGTYPFLSWKVANTNDDDRNNRNENNETLSCSVTLSCNHHLNNNGIVDNKKEEDESISQYTHLLLHLRSFTNDGDEDYYDNYDTDYDYYDDEPENKFGISFKVKTTTNDKSISYFYGADFCPMLPFDNGSDDEKEWQWISIPFTSFSSSWTPNHNSIIKGKDTSSYNAFTTSLHPTNVNHHFLNNIFEITLHFHSTSNSSLNLDMKGIYVSQLEPNILPSSYDQYAPKTCLTNPPPPTTGQKKNNKLRFNSSSFYATMMNIPFDIVDEKESLAQAVCCDPLYKGYAEPRGFYARNDVDFFSSAPPLLANKDGETETKTHGKEQKQLMYYYDSICNIPIFIATKNRSWDDFVQDTTEHGWPSFRYHEVVQSNVYIGDDGRIVYSACGTRLGTYEPDEYGPRYCVDVSCIAGGGGDDEDSAAATAGNFNGGISDIDDLLSRKDNVKIPLIAMAGQKDINDGDENRSHNDTIPLIAMTKRIGHYVIKMLVQYWPSPVRRFVGQLA